MSVEIAKAVSLSVLFLITTIFGTLPICVVKLIRKKEDKPQESNIEERFREKHGLTLSLLLNFAGGVLLATSIVHMIPEIREEIREAYEREGRTLPTYPVVEVVLGAGFFMVYAIEEIIRAMIKHQNCPAHVSGVGHEHSSTVMDCEKTSTMEQSKLVEAGPSCSYGSEPTTQYRVPTQNTKSSLNYKSIILIVALSFHSLFEGISIGLQNSESKVWTIFFGISIHKVIIAFCVGFETYIHNTRPKIVVLHMIIFALMSPLGGAISSIMDSVFYKSQIALIYLEAVSAGTILYVTFFEIFFNDKINEHSGLLKLASSGVGFTVMCLLGLLE